VSIVVGLIVGFFTAPLTGLVSLILCVLALRFRHTRVLLFLGSTIALLLAGLVTAYLQHKYIFPWALGWPDNFGTANTCAWITLALLFVDGVADVFRERLRGTDIGENAPDNSSESVS
jgi:predicted membrane protein